jgi:hypothetical protein
MNAELRYQVSLGHVPRVLRAEKGLPIFTETEATLSVDIVVVEFNLNGLSDNAAHISGLRGVDGRIVEMNAVFLVDNVFN